MCTCWEFNLAQLILLIQKWTKFCLLKRKSHPQTTACMRERNFIMVLLPHCFPAFFSLATSSVAISWRHQIFSFCLHFTCRDTLLPATVLFFFFRNFPFWLAVLKHASPPVTVLRSSWCCWPDISIFFYWILFACWMYYSRQYIWRHSSRSPIAALRQGQPQWSHLA